MAKAGGRLWIQEEGDVPPRALFRIAPDRNGGFYIFTPYMQQTTGIVMRPAVPVGTIAGQLNKEDVESWNVSRPVKLSVHGSGFIQVSGDGVISGLDAATGAPRGAGIFNEWWTLNEPIAVIDVWGLQGYATETPHPERDLVFGSNDFEYWNCDDSSWQKYKVVISIFRTGQGIILRNGQRLFVWHDQHGWIDGLAHYFRVFDIDRQDAMLGVLVARYGGDPDVPDGSAFLMASSTQRVGNVSHWISIMYPPPPDWTQYESKFPTLDYNGP